MSLECEFAWQGQVEDQQGASHKFESLRGTQEAHNSLLINTNKLNSSFKYSIKSNAEEPFTWMQ